jgi:hypothetical protein
VIQSFSDETTTNLLRERHTRAARQVPQVLWRVIQRKLESSAWIEPLVSTIWSFRLATASSG